MISILIGWWTRPRRSVSANHFLNASRALPLPLVVAAFLAANCGALEVVGLSAMAAQYGALAFHFYWIGAIPAMLFLGLYVLPVYRASGARSVTHFLATRFGTRLGTINAVAVSVMMVMLSGISLYAIAQVLEVLLHMPFLAGVLLSAGVVLVYVLLGGLRATVYTEVFQLIVMVAGLLPLCWRSARLLYRGGGFPGDAGHVWRGLHAVQRQAPMDGLGLIFGLGFVLSFGYWCTDFVLMQRALSARTVLQARTVPLWAGFGKLIFGFLVILPGLAAVRLVPHAALLARYDQSLPDVMVALYGPATLGLGLTALSASLMSGLAANVSGLAALCTEDLYRRYRAPDRSEAHYLRVSRVITVLAVVLGLCCSFVSFFFRDLMEQVQLIFALLNAPFWAVFLLGVGTRRIREGAACTGFLCGVAAGTFHLVLQRYGWLHYGSQMASNFYSAMLGFTVAMTVSLGMSLRRAHGTAGCATESEPPATAPGKASRLQVTGLFLLAGALLAVVVAINWVLR